MKKSTRVIVISLGLLGLIVAATVYCIGPRDSTEIQFWQAEISPDKRHIAIVQLEAYNTAWVVNDVVYAVRLIGPARKDREGDLIMNVPVHYPHPAPSIEWRGGKLLVTLKDHQKYQYFKTPVSGVEITTQEK